MTYLLVMIDDYSLMLVKENTYINIKIVQSLNPQILEK